MRSEVGQAYDEAREALAEIAADVLPDTCRLIVHPDKYPRTPCELSGGSGNVDGAPYRIRFAWGSPAKVDAAAIVDEIPGRPQITLQLVAPIDSSTALWQEWQATSSPFSGRADIEI